MAKVKAKKSVKRKPQCEVKHEFGCNNQGVRRYTGTEPNDPKFNCCLGCHAMLKRAGVRLKEI